MVLDKLEDEVRKFKMKFPDSIGLEGRVFECTVIKELEHSDGRIGVHVTFDPPLRKPICRPGDNEARTDLAALFGNGDMTQAILFARWEGENLAPHFSNNPTSVYFLVPKGRTDWKMGEFRCLYWASVLEEKTVTFPEMMKEFE